MADVQRREPKEMKKKSKNSLIISASFHKKIMQDICLLVDARMIVSSIHKWAVHSVYVTAAKVQK